MLEHMNDDHQAAIIQYCLNAGESIPKGVEPRMAGVDSQGFYLLIGERVVRVPFDAPVAPLIQCSKTAPAIQK
jgi:putative heme iron utilization protein